MNWRFRHEPEAEEFLKSVGRIIEWAKGGFSVPVKILRGASDDILEQVIAVLRNYEATHPDAVIDLYRQNSVSIRVRIVDPRFKG